VWIIKKIILNPLYVIEYINLSQDITYWLSILKTVIGNLFQLLDLLSHNQFIKKYFVPWSHFGCFKRKNVANAFCPYVKVKESRYRPGQEVKAPRFRDNGTGWW